MYPQCFCFDQYPSFYHPTSSSKSCSGQSIQQISQSVINSNTSDVLCQNVSLYGYEWTIHGTQQSGYGYCGQLSYSTFGLDKQIYYCINAPNGIITGITNQLQKNSDQAVNICGPQITTYLSMQNLSSINGWSTAAFVILSSFAQALQQQTGYPYGTTTTC